MSIARFFNKTVTVKRLAQTTTSGNVTESYSTTVSSSVLCNIQPISQDLILLGEGGFNDTFTMYCSDTEEVKIADQIVDGTDTYTVRGVQSRQYGSVRANHLKISLIKADK